MQNTGIKAIVIDQIRQLAAQYDIQRVLLFGSRARGDYRPRSDIDLAISGGNTAAFTLAVDEETGYVYFGFNKDAKDSSS